MHMLKLEVNKVDNTVDDHGEDTLMKKGERWIDRCQSHGQVIVKTKFKNHDGRLCTWRDLGDRFINKSDFVTINNSFRNTVPEAKAYPGADCTCYHDPDIFTI